MKKNNIILYYIRMFFFVFHILVLFLLINDICKTNLYGYIFLLIEIIYIIKIIYEKLMRKENLKKDIPYNVMQIGYFLYFFLLFYRVFVDNMIINEKTINYLRNNLIIMSILIIFIIVYTFVNKDKKKRLILKK